MRHGAPNVGSLSEGRLVARQSEASIDVSRTAEASKARIHRCFVDAKSMQLGRSSCAALQMRSSRVSRAALHLVQRRQAESLLRRGGLHRRVDFVLVRLARPVLLHRKDLSRFTAAGGRHASVTLPALARVAQSASIKMPPDRKIQTFRNKSGQNWVTSRAILALFSAMAKASAAFCLLCMAAPHARAVGGGKFCNGPINACSLLRLVWY